MSRTQGAAATRLAIIGAGFAGLGMAIRLKQEGIDDFLVLERADGLGGTWRDNTLSGLRGRRAVPPVLLLLRAEPGLDAASTHRSPRSGPTSSGLAREHDVLRHVRFGHEVAGGDWDEDAGVWHLQTAAAPSMPSSSSRAWDR